MSKFQKYDIAELLGFTSIARVSDQQIWSTLVSPMVKALLGKVTEAHPPRLVESQTGLFKGDQVSNLNNHLLYGGQPGYVRFPYLYTLYNTEYGALVIKRDGVKFEAMAWTGQIEKDRCELIFKAALRDRRYDGTKRANDSALVDFPYDDPILNKPLPVQSPSVEFSIYGFLPGSKVVDATGEPEFDKFIKEPFGFLDRPELFAAYFKRAWSTTRAPGQNAVPIPDVSKHLVGAVEKIAKDRHYDFIEAAPSHYHVALWAAANGYRFTDAAQAKIMADFQAGIKKIKAAGIPLTRAQESWLCVVQSLRPVELIPDGLFLNGPVWPQDNIGPQNLWMYKPLNERASKLLP